MSGTDKTAPALNPLPGRSIDQFLETLPIFATIMHGGERMRGASDEMLQGWAWGIQDVEDNIKRLIAEWRAANSATPKDPT